ncbi:homoserine kinase [Ensifer sp. YR511]|uniref:homoserine kinase n=1 Tax=Ensifer sp. YR511 TaxID=1855294 RepID=UPI00088060EC|nr:homoserine kinase [Ensifer sp. YR511]SDO01115.1 homoserine kinase type II [Ensifer sp. YR511]
MAVFTELSDDDLDAIASAYGIKSLLSVIGIADGDKETTYLFRSKDNEFIVTLFENAAEPSDLERAFETMERLHKNGVSCPKPVRSLDGNAASRAAGKLVAIVSFVPGSSTFDPGTGKCHSLGQTMAKIHSILQLQPNRSSIELPTGGVHGALVHENVFFLDDKVSGVINFRLRHDDVLIAEVADVLVDWTGKPSGDLDKGRAQALLAGYESVRSLLNAERSALPAFVMAATARRYGRKGDNVRLPDIAVSAFRSAIGLTQSGLVGSDPDEILA